METEINPQGFSLNWNMALEAGGFLIGDHAKIEIARWKPSINEEPAPVAE